MLVLLVLDLAALVLSEWTQNRLHPAVLQHLDLMMQPDDRRGEVALLLEATETLLLAAKHASATRGLCTLLSSPRPAMSCSAQGGSLQLLADRSQRQQQQPEYMQTSAVEHTGSVHSAIPALAAGFTCMHHCLRSPTLSQPLKASISSYVSQRLEACSLIPGFDMPAAMQVGIVAHCLPAVE